MVYYAGQSSCWQPRYRAGRSHRRIRYNAATGFHEAVGGGVPPVAYPTRAAAVASVTLEG